MYTIRLENTITHQIYEQQVQDNNNGEKLYFRFGVSTFDLVDGEYILTLLNAEGDVLAEDLMRIGDYNPEALQYSKGENTYIDVTLNAVLQAEKYVTITEIQTRIVPDLGNDAIETVYVDAQPLYDSARSEGYDEGYSVGQSEGYPNGFADGYDSGRTDGYNEGYDVGSMDMHLEMLEETRILNVTENGRYFTKYTEDPYTPTGDGDFSDFCKLTNATYQMGRLKSYYEVQETGADVIEFWWRPKDLAYNHRPQLLMSDAHNDGNGLHSSFSINLWTYDKDDTLRFYSDAGGGTVTTFTISSDPEMWYHILLENNGVYVNDEYVGEFYIVNDNETSYVYLNGDTENDVEDGIDECNGYFGMVKINGEVFIPTENGYMNQNTGEILQPIEGGEYEYLKQRDPEGGLYRTVNVNIDTKQFFLNGYDEATQKLLDSTQDITITENGQYGDGETLYKTINVDVAPKINVKEMGLYFGYSTYTEIPSIFDFSDVENMENMFYNNINLKEVRNINTSKVTRFNNAFYGCESLEVVEGMDTSNANEMYSMFYVNGGNANLKKLQKFNCQNVTRIDRLFSRYGDQVNFTDAGGWEGLKCNWDDDRGLIRCPSLTYESCMNIINGLWDFVGNGSSETRTLLVHTNFVDKVGDEGIAKATAKGWVITTNESGQL